MNFNLKEYLLRSENRINYLREIINERPVAILAAGPSIQSLEERIKELQNVNICYFGVNKFFIQEDHILQKINKSVSVVMCSGREGMPDVIRHVINFLERKDKNMFVTSLWRDPFGLIDNFDSTDFFEKYDEKLLLISYKRNAPSFSFPLHFLETNTLLLMIQIALIGKASSIVLFGADGHCGINSKKYYYRQNEYKLKGWSHMDLSLIHDTEVYFNPIAANAIRNTCRTYGLPLINILNCSINSYYIPFPRVSYDVAMEYLTTGKKRFRKLNLETPVKPKQPSILIKKAKKVSNFIKRNKWNSISVATSRLRDKLNNF